MYGVLTTIGRSISFFGKRKIDDLDIKQRSSSNTPYILKPLNDELPVKTRFNAHGMIME